MEALYYELIRRGLRTLESVPEKDGVRAKVKARLDALNGGEGNG
ncbi:CD1375 family protein [Paenibacillus filicis]|uniref:CD1375 family protein n=1 Tax=Paenibacillus filicis TaxID=669464 RepID=A0ABU9DYQ1_9BACL